VTRRQRQRLDDITVAIEAIRHHLDRGDLDDGLVFDAVRVRLIEIGEAVKSLPAELLAREPTLPWSQVAAMPRPPLLRHISRHRARHGRP
jgi:uncharacterized protein with HEPN domain